MGQIINTYLAAPSIFADNFDDNYLDPAVWANESTNAVPFFESSQKLQSKYTAGQSGDSQVRSVSYYDVTGATMQVDCVNLDAGVQHYWGFINSSGKLYCVGLNGTSIGLLVVGSSTYTVTHYVGALSTFRTRMVHNVGFDTLSLLLDQYDGNGWQGVLFIAGFSGYAVNPNAMKILFECYAPSSVGSTIGGEYDNLLVTV